MSSLETLSSGPPLKPRTVTAADLQAADLDCDWVQFPAIIKGTLVRKRRCYIYVNNRLEGCAPVSIAEVLQQIPATTPTINVRPAGDGWFVWRHVSAFSQQR